MFTELNLPQHAQRVKQENGKHYILCQVRKKYLVLTPEEWVRQHLISFLKEEHGYPVSLMKIEREVKGGERQKRADLIVYDTSGHPQLLVECKAPTEKLGKETFFQLGRYNRFVNAALLLISNGMHHYCCRVTDKNEFEFLDEIPKYKK